MINFLHIPKTGGRSIEELIDGHDHIKYFGHRGKHIVPSPSFCIIRNPYDRLVSAYFYLLHQETENEPDKSYRELLMKYVSFKHFVMSIRDDRLDKAIIHLKPMSYFICDENGEIAIDSIFKIEEIDKIGTYLQGIGIDKTLSDVWLNTSEHKHWQEYMNIKMIVEINEIYRMDFELFDYRMI